MNKLKSVLALVLTLCLLAAGAMLPMIVGTMQNQTGPGFGEIQSVDLKLETPLTLMEKLSVLVRGQYYPISKDTALTKEQVLEAVESGLGPYYYRELVPYNWKDVSIATSSHIIYREDAPEINYAIWIVTLEGADWISEMQVDDETGKILTIQFTTHTEQTHYTKSAYAREVKAAWFESVGLSETDWNEKDLGVNGNLRTLRCHSYDEATGSQALEVSTYPNGFWLSIIES